MVHQPPRHVGQGEAVQYPIFLRIARGLTHKACEFAAVLTAATGERIFRKSRAQAPCHCDTDLDQSEAAY